MPFDPAGTDYDPGIPPLDPDRLGLGMLDIQPRQRSAWPERAMRRIRIVFWSLFWLFLGFAVAGTIWATP